MPLLHLAINQLLFCVQVFIKSIDHTTEIFYPIKVSVLVKANRDLRRHKTKDRQSLAKQSSGGGYIFISD